jgi:hypothetical protein
LQQQPIAVTASHRGLGWPLADLHVVVEDVQESPVRWLWTCDHERPSMANPGITPTQNFVREEQDTGSTSDGGHERRDYSLARSDCTHPSCLSLVQHRSMKVLAFWQS